MVHRVKIFVTSSLITMQIFVVASHTVRAHVEGLKTFGDGEARLL